MARIFVMWVLGSLQLRTLFGLLNFFIRAQLENLFEDEPRVYRTKLNSGIYDGFIDKRTAVDIKGE